VIEALWNRRSGWPNARPRTRCCTGERNAPARPDGGRPPGHRAAASRVCQPTDFDTVTLSAEVGWTTPSQHSAEIERQEAVEQRRAPHLVVLAEDTPVGCWVGIGGSLEEAEADQWAHNADLEAPERLVDESRLCFPVARPFDGHGLAKLPGVSHSAAS